MKYVYFLLCLYCGFINASDLDDFFSDEDCFLSDEEDPAFNDLIKEFNQVKLLLVLRGPFLMKRLQLGDNKYFYNNTEYSLRLIFENIDSSCSIKDYFLARIMVVAKNIKKFSEMIEQVEVNSLMYESDRCSIAYRQENLFLLRFDDERPFASSEVINIFACGLVVEADLAQRIIKHIYVLHPLLRGKKFSPANIKMP